MIQDHGAMCGISSLVPNACLDFEFSCRMTDLCMFVSPRFAYSPSLVQLHVWANKKIPAPCLAS